MRKLFICFGYLCVFNSCKMGNDHPDNNSFSTGIDTAWVIALNPFQLDSCLIDLFSSIAKSDSGSQNSEKVHSLTILQDQKYMYLITRNENLQNLVMVQFEN